MHKQKTLENIIRPTIAALGYELWGCTLIGQGRRSILKIFIDSAQGIGLEDCEKVSRQLSAVLDVEAPVKNSYLLEVSSPGLDRTLFTSEQYQRYVNQPIQVKLGIACYERRNFSGLLYAVKEDGIIVKSNDTEYYLPFTHIVKANLVPII